MEPTPEFEKWLANLPPMSDAEKVESLLGYFADALREMDRETLLLFREHCSQRNLGTRERETVLEVIDGHLALRDLDQPG